MHLNDKLSLKLDAQNDGYISTGLSPKSQWIAYIDFVQTQNQCTVNPVNNQTNLKYVWTMMQFFFISFVLRRIKSGLLCAIHSLFQQLPTP